MIVPEIAPAPSVNSAGENVITSVDAFAACRRVAHGRVRVGRLEGLAERQRAVGRHHVGQAVHDVRLVVVVDGRRLDADRVHPGRQEGKHGRVVVPIRVLGRVIVTARGTSQFVSSKTSTSRSLVIPSLPPGCLMMATGTDPTGAAPSDTWTTIDSPSAIWTVGVGLTTNCLLAREFDRADVDGAAEDPRVAEQVGHQRVAGGVLGQVVAAGVDGGTARLRSVVQDCARLVRDDGQFRIERRRGGSPDARGIRWAIAVPDADEIVAASGGQPIAAVDTDVRIDCRVVARRQSN